MKLLLPICLCFVFASGLKAQPADSTVISISDKNGYMEVKIGDTVFTITYQSMYFEYLQNGIKKGEAGDWQGAIADFNTSLLYVTDEKQVYYNRGLAYYFLDRFEEAIIDFNTALSFDSVYVEALSQRGITLCRQGDLVNGTSDLRKAIRLDPTNGMYHYNLAISLLLLNNIQEACTELNKAEELGYTDAISIRETYCSDL